MTFNHERESEERTLLAAIDFSDCSRGALRRTKSLSAQHPARIIVLHVIDSNFITECIRQNLGDEGQIKKKLFLEAKAKLRHFLKQEEMGEEQVEMVVCEGIPFLEINKKAVENSVDMIIIGSCGQTGDMSQIFFGSTAEKVLRFITRPVLCIPPDSDYRRG
jgi:nucleotide-binding universal stress UspA family protein